MGKDRQVYIFAGPDDGPGGLIKFDPDTHQYEKVQVDFWPHLVKKTGCTYVPKLNRIYIFGGEISLNGEPRQHRDEIWYIDLNMDKGEPSTTTINPTQSPGSPEGGTFVILFSVGAAVVGILVQLVCVLAFLGRRVISHLLIRNLRKLVNFSL